MRRVLLASFVVLAAANAGAQSLLKPTTTQRVSVTGSISGPVTPGARVTLWIDVTPHPNLRVYAPGAKEFAPVAVVMTPNAAVTPGTPTYPASELDANSGSVTPVPVYRRTFRIAQPITVGRSVKPGETLRLGAAVNYQACDDRLCYPAASIPVLWTVTVQ